MSIKTICIISFIIKSSFEEWANLFDSKEEEVRKYSELDIKTIFRYFRKYDPQKIICTNKIFEVNIQNPFQANSQFIKVIKLIS